MTAREVIDKVYHVETQDGVPSTDYVQIALQKEGFEIRYTVRIEWLKQGEKVWGKSQYSRPRDWKRAWRAVDRWLAAQIDQEVST